MMKSIPVWALLLTHMSFGCGYFLVINNMPLFLEEALGYDILSNGFFSMLPSLGFLLLFPSAPFFDYLRSKNICSLTNLRKTFNSIGFFIPGACYLSIGFLPNHLKTMNVILLVLGYSFTQFQYSGGFMFSHPELVGPFAGLLFSITNTMGTLAGIGIQFVVSFLTERGTLEEWRKVFLLAGCVFIAGGLVFNIFGDCQRQPWAQDKQTVEQKEIKKNDKWPI